MQRLLIVGCGDVMKRAVPWLTRHFEVYAIARSHTSAQHLRSLAVRPVLADLDQPATLGRLSNLAEVIVHSAPPPGTGMQDGRTRALIAALLKGRSVPRRIVYISTSGIYGDHQGAIIDETARRHTQSGRAIRRVDAEQQLRHACKAKGIELIILRAPGIYAADRLPIDRLRNGTAAINHEEDSYSNHIHADDLAKAVCLALFRGANGRAININDDSAWKMGEWFDRVADYAQQPRPPRASKESIRRLVSPQLWSFMQESRRLTNQRMKRELKLRLAYPDASHLFKLTRKG
ncbi:NAD(P)H-binding protein [Burkholderiaceae bacterium DAT-1]|nr:NAD(P)H-binding protein [Burkholderiaceae bacterium DAT-1]